MFHVNCTVVTYANLKSLLYTSYFICLNLMSVLWLFITCNLLSKFASYGPSKMRKAGQLQISYYLHHDQGGQTIFQLIMM